MSFGGGDVAAQQPTISVADEIKLVEGEPRPLGITISPNQTIPVGGRIVILTLDAPLSFSSGSADAEFGWKLSHSELDGLSVSAQRGKRGQWVIVIGLVDETGKVLARASSLVTIEPSNSAHETTPGYKPLVSPPPSASTETDSQELRRLEEERQAEARKKADEERRQVEAREKADEERRQAAARQKADEERRQAEAREKADEERRQVEARQKADEEQRQAEARRKADEERRQAEARRAADEERQRADTSRRATSALSVAERLVSRGEQQLAQGNVVGAREFFRRAADVGLPKAALLMGDTFDVTELARFGAIGIRPDPAEAKRWYEKARELGALTAATQRLERLKSQ